MSFDAFTARETVTTVKIMNRSIPSKFPLAPYVGESFKIF